MFVRPPFRSGVSQIGLWINTFDKIKAVAVVPVLFVCNLCGSGCNEFNKRPD